MQLHVGGAADSVLIKEVALIQSGLYREVPYLYCLYTLYSLCVLLYRTGTAPSAMVDQGTSPVAVADPSDALHSELAAAQEEALRLAQQLQVSQDTQLTKEGEVVR